MIGKKRLKALLLAGVMTMSMCLGATAFAKETTAGEGTEENPAEVSVTKTLKVPEGTAIPNLTFEFNISQTAGDSTRPSIADISYTSADALGELQGNGTYHITKTSAINFGTFTHAGLYEYTVTETTGSAAGVTYDTSSYDLNVYVVNGENGVYVETVTAEKDGAKVPAVEFVNSYVNEKGADLTISKAVTGDLADKTKDFSFTITFTADPVSGTDTFEGTIGGETISCKAGQPTTFRLHDGESLVFGDIPAGTRYVVTETGEADGYTPSVVVTENGVQGAQKTAAEDASLSTADQGKTNLAGEGANSADFTNAYQDISITGIFLNAAPFLALLAAAVLAFAALAAVKRAGRR